MHRDYKYVHRGLDTFVQFDLSRTLSSKNELDGPGSFGLLGHLCASELIHFNQFTMIPAIRFEATVSGVFKAFDVCIGASVIFVYQNFYAHLGVHKGLVSETIT